MCDFSSLTTDQTCIPCIGRRIFNHWTAKDVPDDLFLILPFLSTLTGLAILDLSKYFLQSDGMSSLDRMSGGLDKTWGGEAQEVLRTRKIIYK